MFTIILRKGEGRFSIVCISNKDISKKGYQIACNKILPIFTSYTIVFYDKVFDIVHLIVYIAYILYFGERYIMVFLMVSGKLF